MSVAVMLPPDLMQSWGLFMLRNSSWAVRGHMKNRSSVSFKSVGKQEELTWSILFPRSLDWSAVVMLFVSCVRVDRWLGFNHKGAHYLTFASCLEAHLVSWGVDRFTVNHFRRSSFIVMTWRKVIWMRADTDTPVVPLEGLERWSEVDFR